MGTIRPCLLIPIYNHGEWVESTLKRLAPLELPCLLIDDGSNSQNANILDRLAATWGWITLIRLSTNGGKGAAVLRGISEARSLGYSHAIQVDADGQHTVEDIPRMLEMAEAEPEALISGAPIYDESVPKSRLYGRYFTHFWVWIETLSFSIIDSMCGFRIYPVNATDELARSHAMCRRMDFDTDVMVRLFWRGVPVRFLKTRVNYPENGISHFQIWQDNLRISRMHTFLTLGMLPRLPLLLWRKLLPTTGYGKSLHWAEIRENGSYFGMAISVICYRVFGRYALYALLYPIVGYFFITNRRARKISRDFLCHVFHYRRSLTDQTLELSPPKWRDYYQHFMNFSRSIVDRIGAWVGDIRRFQVDFPDRRLLQQYIDEGRGAIILSSHLGNIEMCRGLVDDVQQVKMNVLVFNDNAKQINRLMKRINPRVDMELIPISAVGPDTAMMLHERLDRGEFVVIAADRTSPSAPDKSIAATFMGKRAYFPKGVFILAGLLDRPVFLMFCLREKNYRIYLEQFAERMPMPRKQRTELLQEYVQRYALRLEHYALKAPKQWYNFFDFWAPPSISSETDKGSKQEDRYDGGDKGKNESESSVEHVKRTYGK